MAEILTAPGADEPPRLKRSDSFLGIHFDFHATEADRQVGQNTTRAMVESIIDQVHPDFLQIDCKGHPGISSYPTKVGTPVPGIVGDPLRVWRKVTAERGVALVMHYSGVVDAKAAQNPGWAVVNKAGKPDARATSLVGPYADSLLIPQLTELAQTYGVDAAWVDGECWGVKPDYSAPAIEAWHRATGSSGAPPESGEPGWARFLEFQREAFRGYLRHYVTEVKKSCPDFQIASNWAFSDHMPEPVSAPVDFLSGDFDCTDSVNSARIAGRYLAGQGMPWDLMAWTFCNLPDYNPRVSRKTAVQIQREAALVLALGGGFQTYFVQKRDGSVDLTQMPTMAKVADFCRARQAVCHHATQVPQVALLLSTAGNYRHATGPFTRNTSPYRNTLLALLGQRYSVELLGEHRLTGRMKQYPLIVIPDWDYLEPKFKEELVAYVKEGGQLLLAGAKAARLFPALIPPNASLVTLEKGQIAMADPASPGQFETTLRRLFPLPLVDVKGPGDVDVVINRTGGKLAINLVNTSGPHSVQPVIESIEAVGPFSVTLRSQSKPTKITLQPSGSSLPVDYNDGETRLKIPKVDIHEIILVE